MIEYQRRINTDNYLWCDDAVLIRIAGGKSALKQIRSDVNYDDYDYKSVLMLNGKPLVQGEFPVCPTCSALLARGYGIEKIDCKELQEIRDKINSDYTDIESAAANIAPLLDLLEDGYYVIADAKLYPTDGSTHYYANVPDKLSLHIASCEQFFNHDFLTAVGGFPAYLYPTQSNATLDIQRAEHYSETIDKANAPRAIAYYDTGFVCALLDGHHKAYAAAVKGCMLSSLVIIPMGGIFKQIGSPEEYAFFSEIMIPVKELPCFYGLKAGAFRQIEIETYPNQPIDEGGLCFAFYPTISELTGIYSAGEERTVITEDLIRQWVTAGTDEDRDKAKCVLLYYAKQHPAEAYMIARTIVLHAPDSLLFNDLMTESYRIIVRNKCEESEQIVLDYMIRHDKNSPAWDICSSYWGDAW